MDESQIFVYLLILSAGWLWPELYCCTCSRCRSTRRCYSASGRRQSFPGNLSSGSLGSTTLLNVFIKGTDHGNHAAPEGFFRILMLPRLSDMLVPGKLWQCAESSQPLLLLVQSLEHHCIVTVPLLLVQSLEHRCRARAAARCGPAALAQAQPSRS